MNDLRIPQFLYGTAWKEDETQRLAELALRTGFRGIDTANQRRHYYEEGVGRAIGVSISSGLVNRNDLFLQTKFTFRGGQDHRLPYDPKSPIGVQIEQSFASSLTHLGVERIDSYLLHGPTNSLGLTAHDWLAWQAIERLYDSGKARIIGVSNFSLDQLKTLYKEARIPPRIVQNRCYAVRGWDGQVREFCKTNGIVYQGFSLLTANRDVVTSSEVARIAKRYGKTAAQIVFRFSIEVGMIPLTGTTKAEHMQADLAIFDFQLERQEVDLLENLATR